MAELDRKTVQVLGVPVDSISWPDAITRVIDWAIDRSSRLVAICNVHVVVMASRNVEYGKVIASADLATPDGAPVAWMLRRMGCAGQQRINGPDLMWKLCERCEVEKVPVFFYGSTEKTLELLSSNLYSAFPRLIIAGMDSPPFRQLSSQEDDSIVTRINGSSAGVVFVGLGCPKQELWMAEHRGRVSAVMIGVGAAFDFHAGLVKRAPQWMQNAGLEWLHRLCSEPGRLWKRYLVTNTLFIIYAARQLLAYRISRRLP